MRVLILDNGPESRGPLRNELQEGLDAELTFVTSHAELAVALQARGLDLIIIDYPLVWGQDRLEQRWLERSASNVPIVVLVSRADEALAAAEVAASAYVLKPFGARRLRAAIQGCLETSRLRAAYERTLRRVSELERANAGLRADLAHDLIEQARLVDMGRLSLQNPDPVFSLARDGHVLCANAPGRSLLDAAAVQGGEVVSAPWLDLVTRVLDSGVPEDVEMPCGERVFELDLVPIAEDDCVNAYGHDITDRVRTQQETQAVQRQREQALAELQLEEADLERKRIADLAGQLERERDLLKVIMEHGRASLVYLDPALCFVTLNAMYERATGHRRDELVGRSYFDFYPDGEDRVVFQRVVETGEPAEYHARPLPTMGRAGAPTTYWDWTITPVKAGSDSVQGIVISMVDVTRDVLADREREDLLRRVQGYAGELRLARDGLELRVRERTAELQLANEALREEIVERRRAEAQRESALGALAHSEARFRAVFESSQVGIAVCDLQGHILQSNAAFQKMVGYDSGALARLTFDDITHPEDAGADSNLFAEMVAGKRDHFHLEKRYLCQDGHVVWGSLTASLVRGAGGRPSFAMGVVEDISDRVRLFEQVQRSRAQLQDLSRRLVEVQENERRAVARELHDEAGQSLTSLKIALGLLQREQPDEAMHERIDALKAMVDGVMDGLHRLAANLRPASLDRAGLVPALGQYVDTFRMQSGAEVELVTVGLEAQRLPTDMETALYRVVQEALTNVTRHARASHVDVIVEQLDGRVVAVVEDDGVGFDVEEATASGRLGLFGMRERVEVLGGVLTVESRPAGGTTILASIPWTQAS